MVAAAACASLAARQVLPTSVHRQLTVRKIRHTYSRILGKRHADTATDDNIIPTNPPS
jgi:hypothetical protein